MRITNFTFLSKGKIPLCIATISLGLFTAQSSYAGPVHAFYADEHNTTANGTTGNRILEIDLDTMSLVNTLDVPGNAGHHSDNGFNSKVYGVPKGSGFVNVIELRKDSNGTTTMNLTKQIDLIHMPRSGDAYNKKFNVVLMVARNRPMGSFINVETDEVVGTIGENVDCTLTDGTQLLSHADANTIAGATKYQCARVSTSHGGDQISGHPYWLTADYAAIVDRTNKQISVYRVWQDGSQLKSELLNHLATNSSIHQIVPRDRTSLPAAQQADFYATEEGEHVGNMNPATGRGVTDADYAIGTPHALLHMRLTTTGLQLVKRMNLQRTQPLSKVKSDRIIDACINIYRTTFTESIRIASAGNGHNPNRESRYNALFQQEGITRSPDQDLGNDFPVDCFYPGIPGGHNADFAPNNRHLYIGMAGGAMSIVDVNRWKIANNPDIGIRSGPGHTCFSAKHDVALTTNHGVSFTRTILGISSERPYSKYFLRLPFAREGLINTYQSHTCYVDEAGDNYYNFWTDGGVFYKMDLAAVAANPTNGNRNMVTDSLYTGGIPIQGVFINLDNIKDVNQPVTFAANNDSATSSGDKVIIDVMSNDTGNNIKIEFADGANHGTVAIVNGKVEYKPFVGFSGTDGFWYGISSPGLDWEWAFVDVTVNSTVPPTRFELKADTATTTVAQAVTIDVLANDTGTGLILGYTGAENGTMVVSNGKLIYTPNAGFSGTEDTWYEVYDVSGQSKWANIIITVTGGSSTNADAFDDAATVKQGASVTISVIANDKGTGIRVSGLGTAWTGDASQSGNTITYTASGNYIGDLDVWYGITDASGNEDWARIVITITQ